MADRGPTGLGVNFYYSDEIERATLSPIADELAARGFTVRFTSEFADASPIGVYACHTNRLFDFETGHWGRPPNEMSVVCLHDFGQSNGSDRFFLDEGWHVFDLGLLPGPRWADAWERAAATGIGGPRLGMRVVGWPKADHVFARPERFQNRVRQMRAELELSDDLPTLLLACSWSNLRQLRDLESALGQRRAQVLVKYPPFPPPDPASPWFRRLEEARAEMLSAKLVAEATAGVRVLDEAVDISTAISLADAVVSNGSNVLYEGVLLAKPGISVRDWMHPAGTSGDETVLPHIDLEGVLTGGIASLEAMVRVALSSGMAELAAAGSASLVPAATLGRAGGIAAEAICEAWEAARGVPSGPVEQEPPSARRTIQDHMDEAAILRNERAQLRVELEETRALLRKEEFSVLMPLRRRAVRAVRRALRRASGARR